MNSTFTSNDLEFIRNRTFDCDDISPCIDIKTISWSDPRTPTFLIMSSSTLLSGV